MVRLLARLDAAPPGSAVPLLAVAVKIGVLLFSRLAATAPTRFPFRRLVSLQGQPRTGEDRNETAGTKAGGTVNSVAAKAAESR
jgi:hypothetical protein